jgi:uncharacterized protein YjbJ (UPF0337 family)
MKNLKNKLNAEKNKAVGTVKESVGKIVGNPKLEAEGTRVRAKGHFQKAVENIKDAARSVAKKSA